MTATASDTPDLEKKELPRIEAEIYSKIALDELIVYAVHYLHEQGVTATVEEVISACFRLFPHVFSLKNYFYWPDSALVTHHLNEAKGKGYIKGSPADGFALKVLGRQVAKQVAISVGLPLPVFIKVKRPRTAEKKAEDIKPSKPRASEKIVSKKQATVKVKSAPKRAILKKTKPVKKAISKKGKTEKAPVVASPAPIKRKATVKSKQKQKETEKNKLPTPARKKEKLQVKHKARKTQSARHLPLPTQTAAIAKPKPAKKKIAAAPAKVKTVRAKEPVSIAKTAVPIVHIPAVSKEEKAKAGKVLHTLERSDAYRQYKKVGQKAKISEFDFRNMLFATMESSAETLKRNVELFKRYAGMHHRQDLATFLNFSEESFAPLLKPSGKKIKTKKK